ncbi:MAG TPA: DUF6325 family protein [Ktedonobacteraceae bacterium]
MAHGPLEYVVVGFEGNHFTGEIWPEIRAIQEKGIVRLIDLVFVRKDENGIVSILEVSDLGEEDAQAYEAVAANIQGLMTQEDIAQVTADLPIRSSAAIALFEHAWAIGLREAIRRANGKLLRAGMVRADTLEVVDHELDSMKARQ